MKTTTEVWNEIIERLPTGLTPTEQVVNRVNYFLFNFECGGWLYNLSPADGTGPQWSELRKTADSVDEVGSPVVARALRKVVEIAERANLQISVPGMSSWPTPTRQRESTSWSRRFPKRFPHYGTNCTSTRSRISNVNEANAKNSRHRP